MRLILRLQYKRFIFFGFISKIQVVKGISSHVGKGNHVIMWDMENCTLEQAKNALVKTKFYYEDKYGKELSDIYIVMDKPYSYRAWCFTQVDLKTLCELIVITDYIDKDFFFYTVRRREAILRTSRKLGRSPQVLVAIIKGKKTEYPKHLKPLKYETSYDNRKVILNIGEKN